MSEEENGNEDNSERFPIFAEEMEGIEFFQAFQETILLTTTCAHCGRFHFSKNLARTNKNEFDTYYAKAAEDPDEYHYSATDIPVGMLDGKQYVLGCPCHKGRIYEELIWNARWEILEFFRRKAIEMQKEGVDLEDEVATVDDKLEES